MHVSVSCRWGLQGAVDCVETYSVKIGIMIKMPSVAMFNIACASATLLRHVLLPLSGLQGPDRMTVNAIVYAMIPQATIYRDMRYPILTSMR